MRRDVLLTITVFLLLALLPTILFDRKSFASYDVCPYSKTYRDVYPEGTFVLKAFCVDELSRMLRVVRKALDVRHNKGMLAKRLYGEDCMEVAYVNQVHGSMAYLARKFSLQKKPSKISLKHRLERVDGVPISVVGEHHQHGKRRPQITEIA